MDSFFFLIQMTQIRVGKGWRKGQFQGGEGLGKIQFDACCREGRADGCQKSRSWDESQKEPGADMGAEVVGERRE